MAKPTIPGWEATLRGLRHHCRACRLYYAGADGVPQIFQHGHDYEVRGLIETIDEAMDDLADAWSPEDDADEDD